LKKFLFLIVIFTLQIFQIKGQENNEVKTIKIKKEAFFTKAVFDEAEYKVVAIDKNNNPHFNAIKSFVIIYKGKKNVYQLKVEGNVFPKKTIDFLTKKKKEATKIVLSQIKAEDSEGHLEVLPDIYNVVIFPDCKKR
jgi:hypothetical protein